MSNLAMWLTTSRIIAMIPGAWALAQEKYFTALIIFIFAQMTDMLDGVVARKFHKESKMGKLLDQFADKLINMTYIVFLFGKEIFPAILVILYFTYEMLAAFINGFSGNLKLKLPRLLRSMLGLRSVAIIFGVFSLYVKIETNQAVESNFKAVANGLMVLWLIGIIFIAGYIFMTSKTAIKKYIQEKK